eukprot:7570412-Pyramimonas_sp.AAC.2
MTEQGRNCLRRRLRVACKVLPVSNASDQQLRTCICNAQAPLEHPSLRCPNSFMFTFSDPTSDAT